MDELTEDPTPNLKQDQWHRPRAADGKFMAASERVHISSNPAGDLQEGSLRSPSVVPMYHGYDGNLQTRYRQTPALAQETKPTTTSKTPRSRRQTPLTDDEMWDETICDGGQAALAFTRGSSPIEAIPDPVIFVSMLLDPTKFTPDLAEWKKEHNRTMPRLMQAYSKYRPEISDAIAALTKSSGYECRIQIDRVVQTMFAADRLHPAAAYCLMILMWYDHPKSMKRDMISLIVEDYLLTPDDMMDDLIEASLKGSTLNITIRPLRDSSTTQGPHPPDSAARPEETVLMQTARGGISGPHDPGWVAHRQEWSAG